MSRRTAARKNAEQHALPAAAAPAPSSPRTASSYALRYHRPWLSRAHAACVSARQITNHHVALSTIQKVSTPEKDWVEPGFSARLYGSEVPGTGLVLRQLVDVKNVTEEVLAVKAEGGDVEAKLTELCAADTDEDKHLGWDDCLAFLAALARS